jgi:DNA topoisomerase-1
MGKSAKKSAKKTSKRRGTSAPKRSGRGDNGKKLVVVESPAKAKTINRYLGNDYVVKASMGHVRDLPAKKIGVDFENRFEPVYEPLTGRRKVLAELKKAAKPAPEIYLATDLDREGEAIAWHLAESLGVPEDKIRRVIFNQITADAIREAFAHPRGIDMDKVNAQQARRILDRIVGYQVSPLLWRKVSPGLSAGRVQSVAVRLIVEREREIEAFIPEEYWKIEAILCTDSALAGRLRSQWPEFLAQEDHRGMGPTRDAQQKFLSEHRSFRAELVKFSGKRFRTDSQDRAVEVARALGLNVTDIQAERDEKAKGPAQNKVTVVGTPGDQAPPYTVTSLKERQSKSRPSAPFNTASMQQAAAAQLRFAASRTMRIAQQLYEGIEVPGEGIAGLITYMRTDSRHLAPEAVGQVRSLIRDRFGQEYIPEKPNVYSSSGRTQEAHEAIRPTDPGRTPDKMRKCLNEDQFKLYDLIWKRFVSCQMSPAIWNVTEADITVKTDAGEATFKTMGRRLAFDGFMRVAGMPRGGDQILPDLQEDQQVDPVAINPTQHFTQPPPRYTEASLVKVLEAEGIGRPSTYASIIQTIQNRNYVRQQDRAFRPTDLGRVVTDKLVKAFPKIFDVRFTADMEDQLDQVEEASSDWVKILDEFYGPFKEKLERASEEMVHAKAETQPSDYKCEQCGKEMVYRFNKNGRYLACTGYPDCKQTYPVDEKGNKLEKVYVDVACPECGKEMVLRRGRFGPFLSCSGYPDCKGIAKLDRKGKIQHPSPPPLATDIECPKCEKGHMNLRRSKRGPWLSCDQFPKCRGRVGFNGLDEDKKKQLEKDLVRHEAENPVPTLKHLDGTPIGKDEEPREVGQTRSGSDDQDSDDFPE